jgi:hypothetical protein
MDPTIAALLSQTLVTQIGFGIASATGIPVWAGIAGIAVLGGALAIGIPKVKQYMDTKTNMPFPPDKSPNQEAFDAYEEQIQRLGIE